MNFDDPTYKGMLSMMPRDVLMDYCERLETTIGQLVYDGSGPECIPEMTLMRIEDEF